MIILSFILPIASCKVKHLFIFGQMRNFSGRLCFPVVRIIIVSAEQKKSAADCTPEPYSGAAWRDLQMLGDCHVHMVLDGIYYRDAIGRHRAAVDDGWIRSVLARYREAGVAFVRDGGDAFGVCRRAAELAPEYGIDYRTPLFPIHRLGRYGGFIGRGFETPAEYRALLAEIRAGGGDFVKLMVSGLMDFNRYGAITSQPLQAAEIRDLVSASHDAGFAVMIHANGADTVRAALLAGADSIEHGSYQDPECLHLLAESDAVWVPTLVTVGNLRGSGRYDPAAVERILEMQLQNVAAARRLGARIALGSDAGAWRVPHVQGAFDEYRLLCQALGPDARAVLTRGEAWIRRRFRRDAL